MCQRDVRTIELGEDSREYPTPSRPPANRRSTALGVIAALVVVALGVAIFASFSTHRTTNLATAETPSATPAPTLTPTVGTSPTQAPVTGTGLPKGVEVTSFALTGPDEGWGTGGVFTNSEFSIPDRGMVLRYSGGSWTQVGSSLTDIYLGGVDMLSPSEGWVMGADERFDGVLLHISGGAWQQIALPVAEAQAGLAVVAMRTPDEGWMAIANPKGANTGANTSLLHYSGGNWSAVPISIKYITDIAPVADGEAWVIGWNAEGAGTLVHIQGGNASVPLTGASNSSFDRLRMFAPNDIWIEGALHDSSNYSIDDQPLTYHYNGTVWQKVDLQAPQGAQYIGLVAGNVAWAYASVQPNPRDPSLYGQIVSIYTNAGGQWKPLPIPYTDLGTITIVSSSADDIWAEGVYMVTTPSINGNGAYGSVSRYVLLHYTGGVWTEYGR